MAFDPLAFIALNNPIVQFIRQAQLTTKLTPTAILRELRTSGLAISTQNFYNLARVLKSQTGRQVNYIRGLAGSQLPDPRQLERTLSDRDFNYTYLIQVTGNDVDTGELDTQYVTVVSNRLLTKDQALAVAGRLFVQNEENYGITYGTADVVDIRQNRAGLR